MGKSKSLIKLSTTSLGILHLINKYIDCCYDVRKEEKESANLIYHWNQGDISYTKSGSGSPLLLLHDITPFSSSYEWSELIDSLSKKYTVYAVDLLGCGKSDKPSITYANYLYVQLIRDFVKQVIQDKTKVIASGCSGNLVLMTNQLNHDIFEDIILISPKTFSSGSKKPDNRAVILQKLFALPIIGKTAYYIATSKMNVEYELTEKYILNPFKLKKSTIKEYYNAAHTSSGNGKSLLASIDGYCLNCDFMNALKNAENPITMINGDHNPNLEILEKSFTKVNKNVRSERVSSSKLLPQIENTQELLSVLNCVL